MAKKKEPHDSVYCACGAQWHGRYTVNNPIITAHEQHTLPLAHANCLLIDERTFAQQHRVKKPSTWKQSKKQTRTTRTPKRIH